MAQSGIEAQAAVDRILLGETLSSISHSLFVELCIRDGLDPEEAEPGVYAADVTTFMRDLCRRLSERHAGDSRVAAALVDWVEVCKDYEAWDSLLSSFRFEGRERYLRRGRAMFPGPLTAHWAE